jgi:hypothetical protein
MRAWVLPLLPLVSCNGSIGQRTDPGRYANIENSFSFNGLASNGISNGLRLNGLRLNGDAPGWMLDSPLAEAPLADAQFWNLQIGDLDGVESRRVLTYLASCALPAGTSLHLTLDGASYDMPGALGLGPSLATGPLTDLGEQERVTACLMARTNARGKTVMISIRGQGLPEDAAEDTDYNIFEAVYAGNLFVPGTPLRACTNGNGTAFDGFLEGAGRACWRTSSPGSLTECDFQLVTDKCLGPGGAPLWPNALMVYDSYSMLLSVQDPPPTPVCGDEPCPSDVCEQWVFSQCGRPMWCTVGCHWDNKSPGGSTPPPVFSDPCQGNTQCGECGNPACAADPGTGCDDSCDGASSYYNECGHWCQPGGCGECGCDDYGYYRVCRDQCGNPC